jgi:hypothetical protein
VPEGREQDGKVRVHIAFEGGQNVAALVPESAADGLAQALAREDATFDLETEDGTYVIALGKVVYVRRSSREPQIGFGLVS